MKKTPTKKEKPTETTIEASIKILGKTFTGEGKTVSEAIENIKPAGVAKGMAILIINTGETVRERVLTPIQTFRMFNGGRIMREMAIKNISILF